MKNLKVSHKLALGFAAVLFLTVLVAVIGVFSMDALVSRSDKAEIAQRLLNNANEIRYAQVRFEERGDTRYVSRVADAVKDIVTTVDREQDGFVEAQSRQYLQTIAEQARRYQSAFDRLAALRELKQQTRANWVDAGNTTDKLIADLERRWHGVPGNPVLHPTSDIAGIALLTTALSKQNRLLRFTVRGYLMEESEPALQALNAQFDALNAAIAPLEEELIGPQAASLQVLKASATEYVELVKKLPPLVAEQQQARQEMETIFATLYEQAQGIIASQTEKRTAEARSKKLQVVGVTLLAILLGMLVSVLIVRQIVQPLNQAVRMAERIGAGDMTGQDLNERRDEFGLLLQALAKTRGNLHALIGRIGAITTQLATASEELSAVTEQTSAGVNSQRQETDQVATAMHQMTATVQEVARSAEEASSAAQRADAQAAKGNAVVQRALEQVDRLSSEVTLSAQAMSQLNQETDNISTVLTVINGIAEQTNLLALNAAIEAARAGDQGRGFAVVADEVRTLASRTQTSTDEIQQMIEGLKRGAENAVSSMHAGRAATGTGVEASQRTGQSLGAITEQVEAISDMNTQVAAATEEQSSVTEEITHNVQGIADLAQATATDVQGCRSDCQALSQLAEDLGRQMGSFRL